MMGGEEAPVSMMVIRETGMPFVRPSLGFTAYLADPEHWAQEGASRALRLFLDRSPRAQLQFVTTSQMTEWRKVAQGELDSLVKALTPELSWEGPRHHFNLQLSDMCNLPSVGFNYTEVNPKRTDRAGVLELTLPPATSPELLLQLAEGVAALGPLHSLVGGFVVRWSHHERRSAFVQSHTWARRFVGFDLQIAEETAWTAAQFLPGTNWLTLLGPDVMAAAELDLEELRGTAWKTPIQVKPTPAGPLFLAGAEPTWGDLNAMQFPDAFAEVARALEPALPEEPTELAGAFLEEDGTKRWMRRFLEPGEWIQPSADAGG